MIYATGDTHASFQRFNMEIFPEQKTMNRNDIVLIAGDFGGIWAQTEPHPLRPERDRQKVLKNENYRLDWLQEKNCTFCYVLGNHENWNRYDSDEFEIVDFYGGKAHRIRENVYHLMSGYVFDFGGYTVYAFGGACSHDISEGILDRADYSSDADFKAAYKDWCAHKVFFRVKDYTWWERESIPTEEEIRRGWKNLEQHGNSVNLVLTHCLPWAIQSELPMYHFHEDAITGYLQEVSEKIQFRNWICGHYHLNMTVKAKYHILYEQIIKIKG